MRNLAVVLLSAIAIACGHVPAADPDATTADASTPDAMAPTSPLRFNDIAKDLGAVTLGDESLPFSTKVRNTGDQPVGSLMVTVAGATSQFRADVGDCEGTTLSAGGDCDIAVRFVPTEAGAHAATVTVVDVDDATARATLDVTGTGLTPGALAVEPEVRDLARVGIGATATTTFTVRNSGQTEIAGVGVAATGDADFSVDASACPATLAGRASCDVTVSFVAARGGARSASIRATAGELAAAGQVTGTGVGVVTVTKEGDGAGRGTVAGEGLTCSGNTCSAEVATADYALNATGEAAVSRFVTWSAPCGAGARCVVPIDAAQRGITATFREQVTLTVTIDGPDGAVDGLPATCQGPHMTVCTGIYDRGENVTITLRRISQPGIPRGYINCDMQSGFMCTMNMTTSKAVSAVFRP